MKNGSGKVIYENRNITNDALKITNYKNPGMKKMAKKQTTAEQVIKPFIKPGNLKRTLLEIYKEGIKSVHPSTFMKKITYSDNTIIINNEFKYHVEGRIFVIGAGKAASSMAYEIEKRIPVHYGMVNCNNLEKVPKKIKVNITSHPKPDKKTIKATKKILSLKKKIKKGDIIIFLLSGGASSMLELPEENFTLEEIDRKTIELLKSGASIAEINRVRKKMSKVKGGKLAKYFHPTRIITLVLSDVIGNDLNTIGSSPTYPSRNAFHHILADNKTALFAMKSYAKHRFPSMPVAISTSRFKGNPEKRAKQISMKIREGKYKGLILFGGELTPKLPFSSAMPDNANTIDNKMNNAANSKTTIAKGGRMQHFSLSLLYNMMPFSNSYEALKTFKKWACLALGSDGTDYIKGVAGAYVDGKTKILNDIEKYIRSFNSFNYLKKTNSLIKMKPTGTNVGDLILLYVE